MDAKAYFSNLQGTERKSLVDILAIFRDKGMDVLGRQYKLDSGPFQGYVQLLVRGGSAEDFSDSLKKIKNKGARVNLRGVPSEDYQKMLDGDSFVYNSRTKVEYKGTNFDINYARIAERAPMFWDPVDLIVNKDVRKTSL